MTRSLDQALLQGADISAMAAANLLVNGFCSFSQENGDNVVSGGGNGSTYVLDQWTVARGGAPTMATSAQRVSNPFPSQPDIPYGLKLSITTAQATLASGDSLSAYQPIEGTYLSRLQYGASSARPVTIAFMLRPNFSGTAGLSLINITGAPTTYRSIVRRLTMVANQDNFYCITLPGDQVAALGAGVAAALQVRWVFAGGSSTTTNTLETWSNGILLAPADVTNSAATAGNNVIISGCVALPGIVPITQAMLPLLARPYDDELRKCQRYFTSGIVRGPIARDSAGNNTYCGGLWRFPVPMRSTPTFVFGDGSGLPNLGNLGKVNANGSSATINLGGVGQTAEPTLSVQADAYLSAVYYGWFAAAYTANARM